MNWFDVDKAGLAKLLERKGKAFAIFELLQNAWDTNARHVSLSLTPIEHSPYVLVYVEDDDPEGFAKLSHAFTLFAESDKKGDPTKRGRFNLGEKLVLALCRKAHISSTSGTVFFTEEDGRYVSKTKRETGSEFRGELRMTRDELAEVQAAVRTLIPPRGVLTTMNGEPLLRKVSIRIVDGVALETEISDYEGYLRKTKRQTSVTLYEVKDGETATLYEMGIPVVELPGDRWHVEVGQKVPLNIDRDNVTPAYLRALCVEVLNMAKDLLLPADAAMPWINDAAGDERASKEAIEQVLTLRFGEKRVIADPTDPEGTKLAMSKGYTVIPGGSLSGDVWHNVKRFGAALPAGKVTPSPKPYSDGGRLEHLIMPADWTPEMRLFARSAEKLGKALLETDILVRYVREPGVFWGANYGGRSLMLNLSKLGRAWLADGNVKAQLELLIHEFAHHYEMDHLSSGYHDALCFLGVKMAMMTRIPGFMRISSTS